MAFGTFKIKIPFEVTDLSKPIFIQIGATVGDGQGYPDYGGPQATNRVALSGDNSSFLLTALYQAVRDATGEPKLGPRLPDFITGPFEGGGWEGFFAITRQNQINNTFSLETSSLQPGVSAGGSSQSCKVLDTPPPPPPPVTGHRLVVRTDPTKVSADGNLVWKDDIPEAVHSVEIVTGIFPRISVDGVVKWAG